MNIYLQSFFSEPNGIPYSVCRWQPKGFEYETVKCLQPYDRYGKAIKGISPEEYLEKYCETLVRNHKRIRLWLKGILLAGDDITLCCWCNEIRQKNKGHDKLFCHTILIGYFIETISSSFDESIEVSYLDGRANPVWSKEQFKKCMQDTINKLSIR